MEESTTASEPSNNKESLDSPAAAQQAGPAEEKVLDEEDGV